MREDSGDVALEAEQFQLALRRPVLATHLERRATVRELRLNSDAACLSHRSSLVTLDEDQLWCPSQLSAGVDRGVTAPRAG